MAYQLNGLPDIGTVEEVLDGIIQSEQSFADSVCRMVGGNKTALSGKIPVRGTTWHITRGENQGLAPLEEAKDYEADITYVTYDAAAYVGTTLLSDEERNDAMALADLDALEASLRTARADANTALDRVLVSLLSSTSANSEFDVTADGNGAWTDGGTSSTMSSDLRAMREDFAPGADTIIIGRNIRNVMLDHSNLLATPLGANAYAGGTTNNGVLEEWLKRYVGFTNVYTFEKLYNAAGINQALNLDYLFDDGLWVGYADDLVMVHPNSPIQDSLEEERITSKRAWKLQYTRYDDLIRPTALKAVTATNIA